MIIGLKKLAVPVDDGVVELVGVTLGVGCALAVVDADTVDVTLQVSDVCVDRLPVVGPTSEVSRRRGSRRITVSLTPRTT
jgi:hypothetical protein